MILLGWGCLATFPLRAQKVISSTFRYQADTAQGETMKQVTQVSHPNATAVRLYFDDIQLGEQSYLLLEGSNGAQQTLDAEAMRHWRNSSAYFNGGRVKVSIYQAAGEPPVAFHLKEVRISERQHHRSSANQQTHSYPTTVKNARSQSAHKTVIQPGATRAVAERPYTAAVGRFTNGSDSYGTGWIAPNGAIVTSQSMAKRVIARGYDIIEFNIPASNEDGSVNHPRPEDQYPATASFNYLDNTMQAYMVFKQTHFMGTRTIGWAVVEALPNSTGLRPGQRQQQSFRIATNPGSFTLEAMEDVKADLLHYGDYPEDTIHRANYRVLRSTITSLRSPRQFIVKSENSPTYYSGTNDLKRESLLVYEMMDEQRVAPSGSASGAPIMYHQSNVAIGVHDISVPPSFSSHDVTLTAAIGFNDDYLRGTLDHFFADNVTYVDSEGLYGDEATGRIHKPYLTITEATAQVEENGTVSIAKGYYAERITISQPMTLQAPVGKVVIGAEGSTNSRTIPSNLLGILFQDNEQADASIEETPRNSSSNVTSFPNPFREQVAINYTLHETMPVHVSIHDLIGREIALLTAKRQEAGAHALHWGGRNQHGAVVPAGVYIVRLSIGDTISTHKVMKE